MVYMHYYYTCKHVSIHAQQLSLSYYTRTYFNTFTLLYIYFNKIFLICNPFFKNIQNYIIQANKLILIEIFLHLNLFILKIIRNFWVILEIIFKHIWIDILSWTWSEPSHSPPDYRIVLRLTAAAKFRFQVLVLNLKN